MIKTGGKSYRAMIYLDGNVDVEPGDQISGIFNARVTSEGGSKEPTYHRSEGVFLLLYQRGDVQIEDVSVTPIKYYPVLWRELIS